MTAPPFVFNHRTGELVRGGKMIALGKLHAEIFACFAAAQTRIGCGAIAKAINMPKHAIENEIPRLARRLEPLGIFIASTRGPGHLAGKWLEFEDVQKWRPTIAPPIRLEGEAP